MWIDTYIYNMWRYIYIYIYICRYTYLLYIYILMLCNILHTLYMYVTCMCIMISTVDYPYVYIRRYTRCLYIQLPSFVYISPNNIDKSVNFTNDSESSRTYDHSIMIVGTTINSTTLIQVLDVV